MRAFIHSTVGRTEITTILRNVYRSLIAPVQRRIKHFLVIFAPTFHLYLPKGLVPCLSRLALHFLEARMRHFAHHIVARLGLVDIRHPITYLQRLLGIKTQRTAGVIAATGLSLCHLAPRNYPSALRLTA